MAFYDVDVILRKKIAYVEQRINVIALNLCLVLKKKIHKLYLCKLCANENQA